MKKVINSVKKAILHLNILGLLFIVACGSDNPTGNNNPPVTNNDSLVLTVDSLALYGSGTLTNDTILSNLFANNDSIKVTFSGETNCSISDTAFINLGCGNINEAISNLQLPNSFTFYGRYTGFGTHITLLLKSNTPKFIRVKNAKFYIVNPV